jgi:ubiquinone/menaquinone biosynthesis C-methylase UbiE
MSAPKPHRRGLLLSGAAAAATPAVAAASNPAPAAKALSPANPAAKSRGPAGERLPDLDLEGRIDYLNGQRAWLDSVLQPAAKKRIVEVLTQKGLDPAADLPLETTLPVMQQEPVIALSGKMYIDLYRLRFAAVGAALARREKPLLSALSAADTRGPGRLRLDAGLQYPTYIKREIHGQPGGTVGSPLAGYLARYTFDRGVVEGDTYESPLYQGMAAQVPTPADGRIQRVLELGCGVGYYTSQLKRRFGKAEVWGLDAGAGLVRYAHMKAADMGLDINYVHALAEKTGFPDNHFDVVTAFIFFHEVKGSVNEAIIREAHRILRPGGVFFPVDYATHPAPPKMDAISKHERFWAYRWFHEDWTMDYVGLDFDNSMRTAGFAVNENGPLTGGQPNIVGIKRA